MEKRLPLFFLLSFLVLFLAYQPGGERPVEANGSAVDEVPALGPAASRPGAGTSERERPAGEAAPWRETLLLGIAGQPGHYQATFDNRGGVLTDLRLDGYYLTYGLDDVEKQDPANWVVLLSEVHGIGGSLASLGLSGTAASGNLIGWPLEDALWQHSLVEEDGVLLGVEFTHQTTTGLTFKKTLRVQPDQYSLLFELEILNENEELAGESPRLIFTPAMGTPASAQDAYYSEPKAGICWSSGGELETQREDLDRSKSAGKSFPPTEGIHWAGVDSKYFAVLAIPDGATRGAVTGAGWRNVFDSEWAEQGMDEAGSAYRFLATDLDLLPRLPQAGQVARLAFNLFAGPKNPVILAASDPALEKLVEGDLGFFSGIASLLLSILRFFYGLVGNWGWAIILLTLSVRLVLFPINRRSQTAMARHAKKMKRVQPKLTEIKEKYAKNPQKLRQEQSRIMQEEGAFPPLGGCLPIFLQIPVFFGLFTALRVSFDLRQAPFLGWIHDLSEPDRMMRLDLELPLIGTIEYLNVLPPLMVVLWILQQKVMPKPTDEQALKMQKMMMWMPILFGFFLYNYAAGLSLYMITTSTFGVMEQTVIKKIWPIDDSEQPKKKSGFMGRMADLQKQAQKMQEMQRKEQAQRSQQHAKRKNKKGKR